MCHSVRLAQRNLPAGQKKTTKGLSNKKVLRRRVEIFRKFKFLKFRLTGKYFSEIQKDGHFDEKERKKQKNDKYSEKQSHEKNDKTDSREKQSEKRLQWGRNIPRNPPVPQIGRDNNVISRRTRERCDIRPEWPK